MPLHDWSELPGWDGVHQVWIVELLYWLKPRLPAGENAHIGATPPLAPDPPPGGRADEKGPDWPSGKAPPPEERADVKVQDWPMDKAPPAAAADSPALPQDEPDQEVAVGVLEMDRSLLVERAGQLVAAVELVSPRNKDRPSARTAYASG